MIAAMMSHVKIGFIGGCGHHYLKNLAKPDSRPADLQVAIANDEHDPEASKRFASTLSMPAGSTRPTSFSNSLSPTS